MYFMEEITGFVDGVLWDGLGENEKSFQTEQLVK